MPKGLFRRAFCGGRFSRRVVRFSQLPAFEVRRLRRSVRVDASARGGLPPDFVRAGMRVPDSVPREVRASGRVYREPCIGAMPTGSCVGRFASTLPHGTAPRTSCVPGCVFRIRCPEVRASGRVYRRPCGAACVPRTGSEDRLSAASVRRRNAAERTFPFRCGEGSQYDTGDCGDAAHRTGGCPQRSDPVRRRGGAFRGRSDGAKEGPIAIGAVGAWGLPVVARCRPGEVCEQTDSRTEWRQNSRSEGQKAGFVRETEKCGRGTELRRERAGPTCGFGKRRGGKTDVRLLPPPTGKTERKRIWGRAAGAWS